MTFLIMCFPLGKVLCNGPPIPTDCRESNGVVIIDLKVLFDSKNMDIYNYLFR